MVSERPRHGEACRRRCDERFLAAHAYNRRAVPQVEYQLYKVGDDFKKHRVGWPVPHNEALEHLILFGELLKASGILGEALMDFFLWNRLACASRNS